MLGNFRAWGKEQKTKQFLSGFLFTSKAKQLLNHNAEILCTTGKSLSPQASTYRRPEGHRE